MKKLLLTLSAFLFVAFSGTAVLKERDLRQTLSILRAELERNYEEQKIGLQNYELLSRNQHKNLVELVRNSDQVALMLYSQKNDFTFDMAYACQEATEQFRKLKEANLPFDKINDRLQQDIVRYDGLIRHLKDLPPRIRDSVSADTAAVAERQRADSLARARNPFLLTESEAADRAACIKYATALRENLIAFSRQLENDKEHYDRVTRKLSELNDYAMMRYDNLQRSIFLNGGDNYFSTLKRIRANVQIAKNDASEKYPQLQADGRKTQSEWRGPVILGVSIFMLFYIFLATVLSFVLLKWLLPRKYKTDNFRKKQSILHLAVGVGIFALVVMVAKLSLQQNFIAMATDLMINFAWLLEAILLSLLIRLSGDNIKTGVRVYMPFLCMAFMVIVFRIILISNNIVALIYPPLLVLFTFWQYVVLRRKRQNKNVIPRSDTFYSIISLVVMVASCVVSWGGYALLAVQIMIWWIFQLAAIQTITCLYDLMDRYGKINCIKRVKSQLGSDAEMSEEAVSAAMHRGDYITDTWFTDMVERAVIPVLAVLSVLVSIYWAADTFDMTAICKEAFKYNFVDQPGAIRLSLSKIILVLSLWYVFRYTNYALHSFYRYYKQKTSADANVQYNITLANNIITVFVWGIYCIFSLVLLNVPKTGISVVTAGLATGMGFAMKDLLNNFFYGISLMTGRVRVGDYIECDGVLGKVDSITYQSTQILTLDGSIMAFLNSSLFNKNFKNLTRNHSYVLDMIPVGVAYGSNVNDVRRMLTEALAPLAQTLSDGRDLIDRQKGFSIAFANFGDSSVDLLVKYWVLVDQKSAFAARSKEVIYDTLNANGVEIPFPQRDVYIRSAALPK